MTTLHTTNRATVAVVLLASLLQTILAGPVPYYESTTPVSVDSWTGNRISSLPNTIRDIVSPRGDISPSDIPAIVFLAVVAAIILAVMVWGAVSMCRNKARSPERGAEEG
jgi:hypothetical protein